MSRTLAALGGAAAALSVSVAASAAVDRDAREGLAEAVATVLAAPVTLGLYPFKRWGARRVPPEALAKLIRARFLDDDTAPLRFWTFALTRRTGLIWLHEVPRDGRQWRLGATNDFRPPIRVRVRDLPEDEEVSPT